MPDEVIHNSPLARIQADPDFVALKERVQEATLRGRKVEELLSDVQTAALFMRVVARSTYAFKPNSEIEDGMLSLAWRNASDDTLSPKERASWAKVAMEGMKLNHVKAEMMLRSMGMLGAKSDAPAQVTTIHNETTVKVLTLIDNSRGSHGRTAEEQEVLNDAARKLLFGECQQNEHSSESGGGSSAGTPQDS